MNIQIPSQQRFHLFGIFFLFSLIIYLNYGTGIHSDDYDHIIKDDILNPGKLKYYISYLPTVLYNFSLFAMFGDNLVFYDLFKILNTVFSVFFIYKFMTDYASKFSAVTFSFLLIFYPTHDATNYWIIGQYLIITISLIFISHYCINHSKYFMGFVLGVFGAFYSYASPPVSFGLSIIFLLQKKYKKFVIFIIPEVVYLNYYYFVTRHLNKTVSIRDGYVSDSLVLIKNYSIQIFSAVDSFIGPSFLLKIYYSITQLSLFSFVLGIMGTALFYALFKEGENVLNTDLMISFVLIMSLAFGVFAMTGGYYTQIVFNLGNRVTIFGSILLSYLIVFVLMKNRIMATIVVFILLLSILGISDHWKAWNTKQIGIIENINRNEELKNLPEGEQLFVINNHFSRFGEMSHIEFLSESTINSIFYFATGRRVKLVSLKNRLVLENGSLVDYKYNFRFLIDGESITVYDTETNEVHKIKANRVEKYLSSIDKDTRHWIQLLKKESFIPKLIIRFIPRLEYLFKS